MSAGGIVNRSLPFRKPARGVILIESAVIHEVQYSKVNVMTVVCGIRGATQVSMKLVVKKKDFILTTSVSDR